jgi:hypothetical protein
MHLKTAVWGWCSHFRGGQKLLAEEPHRGRPSTCVNAETFSKVKQVVHADWGITISDVANEVGALYGSSQATLTEGLWMRLVL